MKCIKTAGFIGIIREWYDCSLILTRIQVLLPPLPEVVNPFEGWSVPAAVVGFSKRALCHKILNPAQQQAQLVHAVELQLQLAVTRDVEVANGGVQLLAVDEAELCVLGKEELSDRSNVAVVEVCEHEFDEGVGLELWGFRWGDCVVDTLQLEHFSSMDCPWDGGQC